MKSIQAKLSIGLSISLLSIFFILWLIVSYSLQQFAESYTASRLEHDIETLLTAVEFDQHKKLVLSQDKINPIYKRPFSGHYYQINSQDKIIRSRSLWDQQLSIKDTNTQQYIQSKQLGPEQQALIIISRRFSKQGNAFDISIAEDLTAAISVIADFKNIFALTSIVSLSLLLIVQIIILRKGLKPLQDIKNELNSLEQGQISKLNHKVPSELKPLTHEINHLLSVLQKRLNRSRNALSDLSHAIKKPLTVLHQLADQKYDHHQVDSLKILNTQIESIDHITDRILKRARLSGNIQTGSLFDFKEELVILNNVIKMMYPHKQINIDMRISSFVHPHFDREDILELMGNLLDNAYKWANKEIYLSIDKTDIWSFIIEDDGPGCNDLALKQLPNRGTRLDETTQGHGFGLAIAYDIITDYEGEMMFSQSALLGGFMVVVKLPN